MTPQFESLSVVLRFMRYAGLLRAEILDLRRQVMEREEEIRRLKNQMRRKKDEHKPIILGS